MAPVPRHLLDSMEALHEEYWSVRAECLKLLCPSSGAASRRRRRPSAPASAFLDFGGRRRRGGFLCWWRRHCRNGGNLGSACPCRGGHWHDGLRRPAAAKGRGQLHRYRQSSRPAGDGFPLILQCPASAILLWLAGPQAQPQSTMRRQRRIQRRAVAEALRPLRMVLPPGTSLRSRPPAAAASLVAATRAAAGLQGKSAKTRFCTIVIQRNME
jgi:hypothetical protein